MITPAVLLLVTACSVPTADAPPGLVSRQDCTALLESLREATLERTGPLGVEPGPPDGMPGLGPQMTVPADDPSAAVDLPDHVKLDGSRVLLLSRGSLLVLDGRDGSVERRLRLPKGYATARLLTDGTRALVLADHDRDGLDPAVSVARILLIDLASFATIGELRMPGSLVDARRTGSLARVSVRSLPRLEFPAPPPEEGRDWGDYAPRAERRNKEIVREAPADAFHPSYDVTVAGETTRHEVPCKRINRPEDDAATSVLTVLTFDLSKPFGDVSPLSVAGGHAAVHGTGESLYVAEAGAGSVTTRVHRLDLSPARPVYAGSGSVTGEVLGPEAMSEHEGFLRVAVSDPGRSEGDLYVLETEGPRLETVGRLTDLSGDRDVRSVRFLGERAFVTTSRAQGPLPAFDLSDPAHPRRLDDLAFPAASIRLLPSADGRILAVGQPRTGRGRPHGLRVALFAAAPGGTAVAADARRPGMPGARVENDPRAYLHVPATGLTVLPTVPNSAAVLRVTPEGITQIGRIRHRPWWTGISRALLVGGSLWTFSDAGVMVSDARTLKQRAWTAL